jgi:hypothetical protein
MLKEKLGIPGALVPSYLSAHPEAVQLFERQWRVNFILWDNYVRLREAPGAGRIGAREDVAGGLGVRRSDELPDHVREARTLCARFVARRDHQLAVRSGAQKRLFFGGLYQLVVSRR